MTTSYIKEAVEKLREQKKADREQEIADMAKAVSEKAEAHKKKRLEKLLRKPPSLRKLLRKQNLQLRKRLRKQ